MLQLHFSVSKYIFIVLSIAGAWQPEERDEFRAHMTALKAEDKARADAAEEEAADRRARKYVELFDPERDELRAWACHRCPRAGRAREAARIRRRRARLRWPSLPRSPPTSRTGCASAARYGQSSDAHRASIDSICTGRVTCGLKAPFLCSPRGRKEPSVSFFFEGWWWWPRRPCSMVYC